MLQGFNLWVIKKNDCGFAASGTTDSNMSFLSLGLSSCLARAVAEKNYITATSIQDAAIPAILRGVDVRASAQTGSGKTAAFVLPILQRLLDTPGKGSRRVRVLILAPTRELAAQLGESICDYARYMPEPVKVLVAFGGVSINPQMMAMRGGADIVVATPGRLIDLVDHNAVKLNFVEILVLDEADRLLDLGFSKELGSIVHLLPTHRQNLMFSATFPSDVVLLADRLLSEPVNIEVNSETVDAPDIHQRAIEVDIPRRTQLLRHLIEENKWSRVLVFVATKYATEHVANKLRKVGIKASAMHGNLSQGARTRALSNFKKSKITVLLCTDLAARGIDIVDLPVVVNFDLPRSPVDYVHRIGRTGRAGSKGVAINFVSASTDAHFRLIEKRNNLSLSREQIVGYEPKDLEVPLAPSNGGIKGKRKSKKDRLREAAARVHKPDYE